MPTPAPPGAGLPTCDSCGSAADDTAPVRRVYVTPRAWDLSGGDAAEAGDEDVEVVDEVESWCFPCRSQYPHQPLAL